MAEKNSPTPLQEPNPDADRSTKIQPEELTSAEDVVEDGSDVIHTSAESTAPSHGETDDRRETSRESAGGSGASTKHPKDPRPGHRTWILPTILGIILIAGGTGGAALYLTGASERNETGVAISEMATRIAQHDAELAGQHMRINELQTALKAAEGQITELQTALEKAVARVTQLRAATPNLAALEASLLNLQNSGESVTAELGRFDDALSALKERIESVETQPIPIGELPEQIAKAYDRQIAEILDAVDERFTGMQEALDAGLAEIEAARAAAASSIQDARRSKDTVAAREALARIVSALDSGLAFTSDLGQLKQMGNLALPDALISAATEGVPTRDDLGEAFPEVARESLEAATMEAAKGGEISPIQAFLRTQLGLRSLEPREGDSPDAVLSRAEAATRADDLDTALAEIATLPQSAQKRFADWIALAEVRRGALAAVAAVSAQLGN